MKQAKLQFPLSLVFVLFCGFVPWECDRSIRRKDEIANKSHIFFWLATILYSKYNSSKLPQMPCIFAKEPKKFHKSFWLVCLFGSFPFLCAPFSLFLTLSLSPALFITQFHFVICDNYFCCILHQTKRKRRK